MAMMMSESNSRNSELSASYEDDDSETGITTSGSSDSTDVEDEGAQQQDSLELAKIANELLKLPRGLCENAIIFNEFFSLDTWKLLSENFKTYLKEKHLPQFSNFADDQVEKEKTVNMLFTNGIIRFGQTPLLELQRNLEEGNYRPDVLKLRQSISKSKKRERRFQNCENISLLAKQLFISRERLLRLLYKSSPDSVPKMNRHCRQPSVVQFDAKLSAVRARKRFFTEISQIAEMCGVQNLSDDEENSNELNVTDMENHKELNAKALNEDEANTTRGNSVATEKCIYSTQFKRKHELSDEDAVRLQYESKQAKLNNKNFRQRLMEHKHRKIIEPSLPEFDTIDIRLRDVYTRAQVGGNFKRVFASGKTPGRKPKSKFKPVMLLPITSITQTESCTNGNNGYQNATNVIKPPNVTEVHRLNNQQIDTSDNKLRSNGNHLFAQQNNGLNASELSTRFDQNEMSEEILPSFIISNEVELPQTPSDDHAIRQTPLLNENIWEENTIKTENISSEINADIPATLMQVDKPHIASQTPIYHDNSEIRNSNTINSIYETEPESMDNLTHIENIIETPIIPKKVTSQVHLIPLSSPELIQETHVCYFSLIRDFFCATPNHRMKFDELKEKVNVWLCNPITALNDWYSLADNWSALLKSAINFLAGDFTDQPDEYVPYIEYKSQQNIYQWIGAGRDSDARLLDLSKYWLSRRNKLNDKFIENKFEQNLMPIRRRSTETADDQSSFERGISPPPQPRYPTTWSVIAATTEEVEEFQRQERERFENPHRAYTYRMHGYESIVGPVKGIYSQILALTKARGHSMMIGDRPNFVTILTLVRDATARLPNGEGTRADISELLKCSQYINRDAAENVLQTIVSGALDRMHTEHDPCVRYDPKRKIWIYLHRNRTEEEFERMHQQYQGLGKHKKPTNRKTKSKTILKDGVDVDFISNSNYATTITATSLSTPNSASISNAHSLPALVPANPIIVNTNSFIQTTVKQQQQQQLPKYPPVPPLKYNIQPNQQQKSLLKPNVQPQRTGSELMKTIETNSKQEHVSHFITSTQNKVTPVNSAPISSSLTSFANKSLNFTLPSVQSSKIANIVSSSNSSSSSSNTTPIIVATPTGLKTVHVSNATSVTPTNPSPSIQLVKNDPTRTINAQSLSATVGGKKVALNKPIIINQITQQTQIKTKPQQTIPKPVQKTQQQSFIIPVQVNNVANEQPILFPEANDSHLHSKQAQNFQNIFTEKPNAETQPSAPATKNIIRLVPSVGSVGGKSLITVPVSVSKPPVQIISQRVLTNNASMRPQLNQKNTGSIPVMSNSSASTVPQGAIVRMSSQAFASLQQKQNQHLLVKHAQPMQQHRVVVGKTAINASLTHSNKNIVVQQVPSSIASTARALTSQAQSFNTNTTKISTPLINISPQSSTGKIQTVNANNLSAQQQRILLQNLKQQSVNFKTVQIVSNNATQHQQDTATARVCTTGTTLKLATPITKVISQQNKTVSVVVSQPQNVACVLKSSTVATQQQPNTKDTVANLLPEATGIRTAINDSSGQIISLESLLSKQGKTFRVNNPAAAKTSHPAGSIIQLTSGTGQQGDIATASQYAVVSQPRNVITVGNSYQLNNPQANSTTTVLTSPITMSVGTVKDAPKYITTSGKIVTSSGHHVQQISAQTVLNSNIFGKTTVVSTPSSVNTSGTVNAGVRVIGTGTPTNFNIANIQRKQVILSSKQTVGPIASAGAQKISNPAIILGSQAAKLHGNSNVRILNKGGTLTSQANAQMQTVIMGNQIVRVEQMSTGLKQQQQLQSTRLSVSATSTMPLTTVANTNTGTVVVNSNRDAILQQSSDVMPKTLILGSPGQMVRLQASSLTPPQQTIGSTVKNIVVASAQKSSVVKSPASRVVLAVQGGGQIFLSPNYQGGTVNLKSLQNIKVLSVPQTHATVSTHDIQLQKDRTPQLFTQQAILKRSSSTMEES